MNKYQSMPYELVAGWMDEDVTEKAGEVVFHYHNVAEWLLVLKGQLTFFSADNKHSFPLGTGQVLYIPQGEIHRVEVGPEGTTYRMWTPVVPTDPFRLDVDPDVLNLVARNLDVPQYENRWDQRDTNAPKTTLQQSEEYTFLSSFVADDLIFHTANGGILRTKDEYVWRPPASGVWRSSSGSTNILHLAPAKSVLLSTVVHTQQQDVRRSVTNFRSFVRESDRWVCRLWLNYFSIER